MDEQFNWWIAVAVIAFGVAILTLLEVRKSGKKRGYILALAGAILTIYFIPNQTFQILTSLGFTGATFTIYLHNKRHTLILLIFLSPILPSCQKCNIHQANEIRQCFEESLKPEKYTIDWKNDRITAATDNLIYNLQDSPHKIQFYQNDNILHIVTENPTSNICIKQNWCSGFTETVTIDRNEIRIFYPSEFWKCWNQSKNQESIIQLYYKPNPITN